MDKRHQKRIEIVQELYSTFFSKKNPLSKKSQDILEQKTIIDKYIKKAAPKFAVSKIAKVDLSILRLSIYDLIVEKKEPPKVVINEAIELAKELASEKSPAFVNAVLGAIYEKIINQEKS